MGSPDWASLAGLWHDLGKCHLEFQQMPREVSQDREKRRVDHSTAGAIHGSTPCTFWMATSTD
jgi:CRISPR-associated endonuclease/helicase Cas3